MTDVDDRTEWLTRRRSGIGASDVAGILGLSPWQSPYSVWTDKVGLAPLDDAATESQEFGLMAETMLKQYFEKRTGLAIVGVQGERTHPQHPWMRCTLDGEVWDSTDVYEAKTTSEPPAAWENGVPVHYQCQATWTMAVTGAPRVWFGVLHLAFGRPQFRVYRFDRDDNEVAYVVDKVTQFWNDHVLTGIAPPTDGHTATSEAVGYWDSDPGKTIEAADNSAALVEEIKAAKVAMKDLETAIEVRTNLLKDRMRDAEILTCGLDAKGRPKPIATWKSSIRQQFVKATALAEYPELADPPYTVEQPTRTFLPK